MTILHRTSAGIVLALATVPQAVSAEDANNNETGFYIGFDLGLANLSDTEITYYDAGGTFGGSGARDTAVGSINTDNAVSFGGVLGYDFGTLRTDLELDYSRNKISALTVNSVNGSTIALTPGDRADICTYLEADTCGGAGNTFTFDGSRVRQLSALANLWLDLPIGAAITPYVGGGLGIAGFEVDGEGTGKFAWQLGAGIAANLSRTTALSLDFRRRETGRSTIAYDGSSGFELGRLKTNTFSAGIRFTF